MSSEGSSNEATDETYENPMVCALRGRVFRGSFTVRMEISADPGINGVRIESESIKLPDGRLVRRDHRGNARIVRNSESERVEQYHFSESATPRDLARIVESWQFLAFDSGRMD